jgi:HEAT repeat protein
LGENAVPGLVALLSDPRPRIRSWAADVLGDIGPAASEAVPALVEKMNDDSQEVQQVVREALEKIQPSE